MKMKKLGIVVAAALAVAIAGCLAGCGGSSSSSSSSNASNSSNAMLGDDGVFTVGFDQDFPPYGYLADDGSYTGFDLDLATEVANRNGWTIKLMPINWDAKDEELNSGSIDCIWNGFTIEGREDGYTWTDAYMDNSQVVVVKKDSGINSLSDLAGKTVMAQADSTAYYLLSAGGDQEAVGKTFGSFLTTPEYNTAFIELQQGHVDAVAIDLPVAKFQVQGKEDTYTILSDHLSEEHYGVGFKLGNTELRDTVQSTLIDMVNDGTVEKICEKYADQGISYDSWILGK